MNRGFTLLEVLVAMSLLALGLSALLGHQAVSVQMSHSSNQLGQANLLAQGKLLDLEHTLTSESMDVLDNCEDGNFRKEDFNEFEWKACAYKLEIEDGAIEQIGEQLLSTLSGSMGLNFMDTESLSDDQAKLLGQATQFLGAIPMFLQRLEDKVRKVRLEVTWNDSVGERSVVVERFVTSFGSGKKGAPPPKDGDAVPLEVPM
jgi:prepilin-type N-terminal cleavage/methylation domain-containing protein